MNSQKSKLLIAIALTLVLFSTMPIVAIASGGLNSSSQMSKAPLALSHYIEDFTNDSLQDTVATTAPGWGTGVITNQRQMSISQLDFYATPNKIVDVAVQGRKVYATANNLTSYLNTLFCFNITDPSNIEYMSHRDSQRGFLTGDIAGDVYYNGGTYNGGWVGIYNVSEPYNLGGTGAFITNMVIDGPVTDIEAHGHLLFGTIWNPTSSQGLLVMDVEDPYNWARIPNTITFDETLGLTVDGDLAYVADGSYGLFVMDVSVPYAIPTAIGFVNTPGNATDVLVDGNLAYLADGPEGIHIIDISDPTAPSIIGSIDTDGNARRMALHGSTLFVADENGGVDIIDVTIPNHPLRVAEITLTHVWDVDLFGGILVVGTDSGVYTYRTGMGFTSLPVVGTHVGGWEYWDVAISGNIAYVAAGFAGLMVFDIFDPANPILLNHTALPGPVLFRALDLEGDLLHICDWNSWIHTYNVSTPSYPILISSWGGSGATDIDVIGNVAYIAAGTFGVQIWNVSNPLIPLVITSIPTGPNVTTTEVQGPHLYVGLDFGGGGFGIQIYDISTIALPVLTGQFFLTSLVYDFDIDGDILHMADGTWYVLWNVTDPFNPFYHLTTGWLPTEPLRNIGVEGFGSFCLTTNGSSGITLINGRNINQILPTIINPSVTFARGITIHGDYAYVATNHSFEIIHLFRSAAGTFQTGTAIARSLNIATTSDLVVNATLTFDAYVPTGTTLTFALSADGGLHWETVTPGVKHTFAYPGHDLRWTANLTTSHIDASVRLFEVTIDYEHAPVVIPTIPLPWWWWIAVLVIIIILVVVILVVLLRRRRK